MKECSPRRKKGLKCVSSCKGTSVSLEVVVVVGEAVVGGRDPPRNRKGDPSWGKGKDDTCRRSSVPLMGLKGLLWQVAGGELASICLLDHLSQRWTIERPLHWCESTLGRVHKPSRLILTRIERTTTLSTRSSKF